MTGQAMIPGGKTRRGLALPLALLLLAAAAPFCRTAAAETAVEKKQKNLDEINRQLEEKKQEMEKYREEEDRIAAELSGLKKEESQNAARRRELEQQLSGARSRSSDARLKYDSLEKTRKDLAGDIHGELVMFSLQKDFYYPYYGIRDITKDMLMRSAMFNKRALLTKIKGESARIHKDMELFSRRGAELRSRNEALRRQSSERRTVLRAKQSELEKTREQQARLARELQDLQNAALGLTKLVKKLQKQAPYRSKDFDRTLPIEPGSMRWPADGKVISRFGREDIPALKTWIVREGIRIATARQAPVHPALEGKVIYAGPFRTYGNVVIVDHEKGFFTVYGLLDTIGTATGRQVSPATTIGLAGEDTQAVSSGKKASGSAVYFEIRKGDRAIDPLKWLPAEGRSD